MKMFPWLITIKIRDEKTRISLWLPVFILWPFLFLAALILFPVAALAQIVLLPLGVRPLSFLIVLFELFVQTRGTRVDVQSGGKSEKNSIVKIIII